MFRGRELSHPELGRKVLVRVAEELKEIANMEKDAADPAVQELVAKWQDNITRHYYDCTKEILAGLGLMYVHDERFKENIDNHAEGLAQFMSDAIGIYTTK